MKTLIGLCARTIDHEMNPAKRPYNWIMTLHNDLLTLYADDSALAHFSTYDRVSPKTGSLPFFLLSIFVLNQTIFDKTKFLSLNFNIHKYSSHF